MSKYIGRRRSVGFADETSAGTPVLPSIWIPHTNISFDEKTTTVVEEGALGRIEDSDARHVTNKYAEGDIEFELRDYEVGLLLTSLFGATPVTAGGPTYTHTYTLQNTNTHKSLSIAVEDPDRAMIFPYAVVTSLQLTVEPEGIVQATVGFMSRAPRDWTASAMTPTFTSLGNKFLHQHLVFKLAAATANLAAASNISLKGLELNINTNATLDNVTGTAEPEAVLNHQFSVEGSITLNREDDTYRNYQRDGTYRAMEVTLSRASNSILQLQFPRVSLFEWEQDPALNDIVAQTIQFKGHYDAANGAAIISTAVLTNTSDGSNY